MTDESVVHSYAGDKSLGELERMIAVIRGADAMGLYWRVWSYGSGYGYVVSHNKKAVFPEIEK